MAHLKQMCQLQTSVANHEKQAMPPQHSMSYSAATVDMCLMHRTLLMYLCVRSCTQADDASDNDTLRLLLTQVCDISHVHAVPTICLTLICHVNDAVATERNVVIRATSTRHNYSYLRIWSGCDMHYACNINML